MKYRVCNEPCREYEWSEILAYAFYLSTGMQSVVLPSDTTCISEWAFCGCSTLTTVENFDAVTEIQDGAFSYTGLGNIHLSDKVVTFGYSNPFAGCKNMHSITVDKNNPVFYSVDGILFYDDGNGAEIVAYPNKTNTVYCVPYGIYSVAGGAFLGNEYLESIVISDGLQLICIGAFMNCKNLKEVTIPDSVTFIHDNFIGS